MKYMDPKLEIIVLKKSDIVTWSPDPWEGPMVPGNGVGDDKF